MRSNLRLTNGLVLAALLVLASSCASKEPCAGLKVEAKRARSVGVVASGSDNALAQHDDHLKARASAAGRTWRASVDGR